MNSSRFIQISLIMFCIIYYSCTDSGMNYDDGIANCKKQLDISKDEKREEDRIPFSEPVLIKADRSCLIGLELPQNLSIKTLNGDRLNNDYFQDKVSIINFWMTNCAPCIKKIPLFNAAKDRLGTKKYNFLSIAIDNEHDIEEFLQKHPWSFTQATNGMYLIEDVFKIFFGYPLTLVVDKNGIIRDVLPRYTSEDISNGSALISLLEIVKSNV